VIPVRGPPHRPCAKAPSPSARASSSRRSVRCRGAGRGQASVRCLRELTRGMDEKIVQPAQEVVFFLAAFAMAPYASLPRCRVGFIRQSALAARMRHGRLLVPLGPLGPSSTQHRRTLELVLQRSPPSGCRQKKEWPHWRKPDPNKGPKGPKGPKVPVSAYHQQPLAA